MALVNCFKCGKEVSDTSATCIYCGSSLKVKKKNENKILLIIFGIAVLCFILFFVYSIINKDVKKYEKIVQVCVSSLMVKPETTSIEIFDIFVYEDIQEGLHQEVIETVVKDFKETTNDKPIIVIKSRVYNDTEEYMGYSLFLYNEEIKDYKYVGSCESLDVDSNIIKESEIISKTIDMCNTLYQIKDLNYNKIINKINNKYK